MCMCTKWKSWSGIQRVLVAKTPGVEEFDQSDQLRVYG